MEQTKAGKTKRATAQTQPSSNDLVVFWTVRESRCAECGKELGTGTFLRMEGERALCLGCADLDHLVFLPRGDVALTRRASKYSALRAVVVRFSRARNRYERQGVLIEEAALRLAERECLADSGARRQARERAAQLRQELDAEYVAEFARRIAELFPGCPADERLAIAEHACLKYSGRVGRSAAAKALESEAILLAVRAHVRHTHTHYDELLVSGIARQEARAFVAATVATCLSRWERPPAETSH